MPGPPPTPLHLRLLKGNPGRRPLRPEPQPELAPACPEPPPFLGAYARDEWFRVAPELHRLGLLTVLDINPLAAYAVSYARWRTAEEALTSAAATVSTADGSLRVHPLVRISRDAASDMLRYANEFGLTPVARSRLAAAGYTPPPGGGGKFDGLIA
jgi:P27 family predicted phage terminase small subunit